MMKNKVKLKKYLICTFIFLICTVCLFMIINVWQYRAYTKNFNEKIQAVVSAVCMRYPDVTENEIISIMQSKNADYDLFEKYGVYIEKDSVILENDGLHKRFLMFNTAFFLFVFIAVIALFLIYNKNKDDEIKKITEYIGEINRKNYTLHIDDMSEDELSILKNEIYKTTIMLKESAENSLSDKKQLKESLEDISHQLKTPLTSVLVMLENLIDDSDMDGAVREDFIRDIKREILNINFFVQSILKLSKFDANTVSFIREECLIKDIVCGAAKNVSILCDLKDIAVEIKGDDTARIKCDLRWQTEAVANIIKNCAEHSENGGRIVINYSQNNVYCAILIRDFGKGIKKEDLPHIFERFYKGADALNDSVGIGLALSKTIIEKENGTVSAESETGKGTTFTVKYFMM